MDIAIIRHVAFEDLGHIEPILLRRGHSFQYTGIGEPVDLARAGALIVMGGPMSVNDPEPWVDAEVRTVALAIERNIPVLGICLGAQLIAKALGARVYSNHTKEIGWFPVHWTEAATSDPLFHSLHQPETLFHWHGETFDLPSGATHLASSDHCVHQAFQYRQNIYALQFHPEVTPGMIAGWCAEDANCGDVRELDSPIDPHLHSDRLQQIAALVFGRWADTFLSGRLTS